MLANVKEIMIPHFWWKKDRIQEQRRAELDEMAKQERLDEYAALGEEPPEEEEVVSRDISPAERELELDEYHHMLGTFGDYRDLVLIYGYTVLFVAALPLAPLLALINAYAQIRVDAWNISVVSRRPWPQNAEDIGSWADIIELLHICVSSRTSIIHNGTRRVPDALEQRVSDHYVRVPVPRHCTRVLGTMSSAQTRTRLGEHDHIRSNTSPRPQQTSN